jgi:RNA polymerase-binding transcription factor DksA
MTRPSFATDSRTAERVRRRGSLRVVDPEEARQRLVAEKSRVEGLIAEVREELGTGSEGEELSELSDYDQHPADTGTETFEREKDLSILDSLESELAELEAALQRVDDGTYGVDELTGEPIAPERLEAVPTARTNVDANRRRGA